MPEYKLKLFLAGESPSARRNLENVQAIFHKLAEGNYEIEVIDVLKNPQYAIDENIIATPTLVVKAPGPERRLLGNLANHEEVLAKLGIKAN